jgi:hypothetical protein
MSTVIPPPPPVPRSGGGCWKWGAIGCGALGCIGVICLAIGFFFLMRSPMVKQAMASVLQAQAATQQLPTVGKAIDKYVADKKKYPNELKDLIPTYLPDEKSLRVTRDVNAPRIWYKKPGKNAAPETIVLQTELVPPIPLPGAPPWVIKLRKDGVLDGTEYVYTDARGQKHRVDVRGLNN